MAILLTGGTGKTSVHVARLLQDAKIPYLAASRGAQAGASSAIRFDWLDSSTFEKPFQHQFPHRESISAIYLIAPEVSDPAPSMNAFVDLAVTQYHVKRFVLLTGNSAEKAGYHAGKVWEHLADLGVEYCVLRPTWFMENFIQQPHLGTISDERKIYTACKDGKIPFVSAMDVGAVAFRALTGEKLPNIDYMILGPELLTHDEIAAKLSSNLGRYIKHVKLSEEQNLQQMLSSGVPEDFADFLNSLEINTSNGFEERLNDDVERVTGRPPFTFDAWVQLNTAEWQ